MILTDEEWAMVYAAMKVADAIVMDPLTHAMPMGKTEVLVLLNKESVRKIVESKEELRKASELPHKWRELMEHFHGMFVNPL